MVLSESKIMSQKGYHFVVKLKIDQKMLRFCTVTLKNLKIEKVTRSCRSNFDFLDFILDKFDLKPSWFQEKRVLNDLSQNNQKTRMVQKCPCPS